MNSEDWRYAENSKIIQLRIPTDKVALSVGRVINIGCNCISAHGDTFCLIHNTELFQIFSILFPLDQHLVERTVNRWVGAQSHAARRGLAIAIAIFLLQKNVPINFQLLKLYFGWRPKSNMWENYTLDKFYWRYSKVIPFKAILPNFLENSSRKMEVTGDATVVYG